MAVRPPQEDIPEAKEISASDLNKDMVRWTRVVGVFTGLLFVATIISSLFIAAQWKAATDAERDTRQQLRAVVGQAPTGMLPINLQNKQPTSYALFAIFQTYGNTRPNSFTAWDSVHYFEHDAPNNEDFTKPYNKVETGNVIIGPNSPQQLAPVGVSRADADNVINKAGVIVLWGHAEWSDIFEPKIIHTINFCIYLTPQLAPDGSVVAFAGAPVKPECNTTG